MVEKAIKNYEDVDSWKTIMFLYNAALKEVNIKLDILNDEFQHVHKYNPIEHIKTRIKNPESIVKKLKRDGYETSIENMIKYVNDIAGVRIICSFTSDIYRLAEMIGNQGDLKVLSVKDYIKSPKNSGYKSYHMLVSVPIYLSDNVVDTKVEIQVRTIAMDFWASLEHKIYYKFEGHAPEYISKDLQECAQMVSELDDRMLTLNEAILACLETEDNVEQLKSIVADESFSFGESRLSARGKRKAAYPRQWRNTGFRRLSKASSGRETRRSPQSALASTRLFWYTNISVKRGGGRMMGLQAGHFFAAGRLPVRAAFLSVFFYSSFPGRF